MEMMPDFSNDAVKVLIRDTLRLFVGFGRRISWADLALATGDREGTLRSYVEADGPLMPLDVFMRVFAVLPPEAFGRCASRMGFSTSPLDVDDAATVRRGIAACARFAANGAEALEDGVLSHTERASLADDASNIIPIIHAIAGNGSGPR